MINGGDRFHDDGFAWIELTIYDTGKGMNPIEMLIILN